MKKQLTKRNKILIIMSLVVCVPLLLVSILFISRFALKSTKKVEESQTSEIKQPIIEEKKEESTTPEKAVEPPKETPKETQPSVTPPKNNNSTLPAVSTESPTLSVETANKISLSMTSDEVKKILGNETFESALKAGGNLTALTIKIPNTDGGIVIGFNDEKVNTITRTYTMPLQQKEIASNIKKGMSYKEVKDKFGAATIENGEQGTRVLIYKYTVDGATRDLVVAFDSNDKVLVVS